MTTEPATTGLAATGPARTDPVRGGEDGTPLTLAGWHPGRDAGDAVMIAALKTAGPGPWSLFPAAERAVREFHGLRPAPAAHGVALGGPAGFPLTLAAGPGTSVGRPSTLVDASVAAFDAWAAAS